jgi:N-ethylmaleimide reductase
VGTFTYVLHELSARKIAYAHLIEPRSSNAGSKDSPLSDTPDVRNLFRAAFTGALLSAGGYDGAGAKNAVSTGEADAVAFGRLFIANPDLPRRLQEDAPLNPYNRATFYGGGEKGYTDYPTL